MCGEAGFCYMRDWIIRKDLRFSWKSWAFRLLSQFASKKKSLLNSIRKINIEWLNIVLERNYFDLNLILLIYRVSSFCQRKGNFKLTEYQRSIIISNLIN